MHEHTRFQKIDQLFDGLEERLQKGVARGGGLFDRFASDHFLLNRSWQLFRQRIRENTAHWESMLESRTRIGENLAQEVETLKDNLAEAEGERRMHDAVLSTLSNARAGEWEEMRAQIERLKTAFEEERGRLEATRAESESRLNAVCAQAEAAAAGFAKREAMFRAALEKARDEHAAATEERLATRMEGERIAGEKEDRIRALATKIDLLRSEVDRRDAALAQSATEEMRLRDALKKEQEGRGAAHAAAAELQEELAHLRRQTAEAATQRKEEDARWRHTEAQWRELWDRARAGDEQHRRPRAA